MPKLWEWPVVFAKGLRPSMTRAISTSLLLLGRTGHMLMKPASYFPNAPGHPGNEQIALRLIWISCREQLFKGGVPTLLGFLLCWKPSPYSSCPQNLTTPQYWRNKKHACLLQVAWQWSYSYFQAAHTSECFFLMWRVEKAGHTFLPLLLPTLSCFFKR